MIKGNLRKHLLLSGGAGNLLMAPGSSPKAGDEASKVLTACRLGTLVPVMKHGGGATWIIWSNSMIPGHLANDLVGFTQRISAKYFGYLCFYISSMMKFG